VTPRSGFSAQTLSVLAALAAEPAQWHHGYALAKETQLKSGSLYPILIRLADRGLVEAQWQDEPQPGRPRRHLYRLTAGGLAATAEALATAEARVAADAQRATSARPARSAPRSGTSARLRRSATAPGVSTSAGPCAG
jgi:PadR family transcriptional regulator, regulatory protein PadR